MSEPANRGLVLQVLHTQYPLALTRVALESRVLPFYGQDSRELARDIAYLEDKGYLRQDATEVDDLRVHTFRITANGVDVGEKRVQVPGVAMAGTR